MKNEYLRHTLSTIHYRFNRAVSEADTKFGDFDLGGGVRTPCDIINHMFQVLNWTKSQLKEEAYEKGRPIRLDFPSEVNRFNVELSQVDQNLKQNELDSSYTKRLLQGPFSDIISHVGQLAMLSRIYGKPVNGEDFSSAKIKTGLD